MKPSQKPENPYFSSGPCPKRPGWDINKLNTELLGRSHRSKPGKALLKSVIDKTHSLLGLPAAYRVGIVPASDTGAFEMAMWSLLNTRPVDVFAWESFGQGWITDLEKQLKLENINKFTADYGQLPDLSQANPKHDIVFTWNGTTSGVKVPNGDWLAEDREGLTLCDATSAVFAMDLPWEKLDVVTFSWQKVLGGEAAHGVLILSPRAVDRLESWTPPWPLPKIFRLTKKGKLNEGIFEGATINTPSMLAVEDCRDALDWVESIGGASALRDRSLKNLAVIEDWVAQNDWIDFLAESKEIRSNTSVCLKITADWFQALDTDEQAATCKNIVNMLSDEGAGYDIGAYRDAPAGFRIWAGGTVEAKDIEILLSWLEWAYNSVRD